MKKKAIITLLTAFILVLTTSVTAFAEEQQYEGLFEVDPNVAVSQYSGDDVSAAQKERNKGNSYFKITSPADNARVTYKGSMTFQFRAWDAYSSDYTLPVAVLYKNGRDIDAVGADKPVKKNGYTDYKGTYSLSKAEFTPGVYTIEFYAIPCDYFGKIVSNADDYDWPTVVRTFYIGPSGKVTIKNTIANSAKRTNDVIWDKSRVNKATNYQISWRAKGGQWAYKNVGNTVRGTTTGLKVGQMYEIRVRPYGANNSKCYGAWSDTVYRYFHTTEKIRLRSSGKGQFTISWKHNPNATSYQVMFTTNKNGSGAAKNINNIAKGNTSFTKKGLKSGVTYYVQIREVRNYAGKNWIGNISVPVAVKVK